MTPNESLLNAVSEWSRLVAGCDASELRITLADGLVMSLLLRRNDEVTPKPPTPMAGWSFVGASASYAGKPVAPIKRSAMAVLRVLVDAEGSPISSADLAAEAWPDYAVDQRTVNNAISALRKAIRDSLGTGETDPVPCVGGAYRLVIE